MGLITERVAQARAGQNEKVICRMPSGWEVMGDVQFLRGYCLLLPDPVVTSLNDLTVEERSRYLLDMARIGDAVLQATGAPGYTNEAHGPVRDALRHLLGTGDGANMARSTL